MEDARPRRILDLHAGRTPGLTCIFGPRSAGDGTPVMMAASLGLPVRLTSAPDWSGDVLSKLADYFLYGPVLQVPIEPFAGLAKAIAEMGGRDLWQLYGEALGRDFFVAANGTVSLSERWQRLGRSFGTLSDSVEAFRASGLWGELADLRRRTFLRVERCATCPHHPWCGGFWLAPGGNASCDAWRAVMDQLVQGWRESTPDGAGAGG